jgi:hypothetical protein
MTKGEYRVGVNFNPGGHEQVDGIKNITAGLIDEMERVVRVGNGDGGNREAARCAAIAQTRYEEAAMWAVKAVTKPRE